MKVTKRQRITEMQAGSALDALVAEKVMGYKGVREYTYSSGEKQWILDDHFRPLPRYSSALDEAWKIIEKLLSEEYYYEVSSTGDLRHACRFFCAHKADSGYVYADTPELAICRAALLTVIEAQK